MNNFIPHIIIYVNTYPWWDQSLSILVKRATGNSFRTSGNLLVIYRLSVISPHRRPVMQNLCFFVDCLNKLSKKQSSFRDTVTLLWRHNTGHNLPVWFVLFFFYGISRFCLRLWLICAKNDELNVYIMDACPDYCSWRRHYLSVVPSNNCGHGNVHVFVFCKCREGHPGQRDPTRVDRLHTGC